MFYDPHSPPGLPLSGETRARRRSARKKAERAEAQRRARRARFAKLIDQFEADEIEAAVDGLIAMLDARDGDPDVELNGDEFDGCNAEDDCRVTGSGRLHGPGCEISDPGEAIGDDLGDVAWTEWHGRSPGHRRRALHEQAGKAGVAEDDEEDDEDRCEALDDDPQRAVDDGEPGDPIDAEEGGWPEDWPRSCTKVLSDLGDEEDGWLEARRAHRDRIRRTRCLVIHSGNPRYGWTRYQLRYSGPVASFGRPA